MKNAASSGMTSEQIARWERIFDVDLAALDRQVQADPRLARRTDGPKHAKSAARRKEARSAAGPRTRRLDEHTRTKRGGVTNRKAQAADRDPPKPILPKNMVTEAEDLVRDFERQSRTRRRT